jgi:hypothetical protein
MNYKTSTNIIKQECFDTMKNFTTKKVHKFKVLTQINKLQKPSQLQQNKKYWRFQDAFVRHVYEDIICHNQSWLVFQFYGTLGFGS